MRIVSRWLQFRRTRRDMVVIGLLASGHQYAADMWQQVGGSVGWIYLSLARLERAGVVVSAWAEAVDGAPRRRYYRLANYRHLVGLSGDTPRR